MAEIIMVLDNAFHPDVRVYNEATALVRNGHDVTILALDKKNEFVDKAHEVRDGIVIQRIFCRTESTTRRMASSGIWRKLKPLVYGWWYVSFVRQVRAYIKSHKCDFIHCHDIAACVAGLVAKRKDHRLVFDMHEHYMSKCRKGTESITWWILGVIEKASYKIFYVTEAQLADLHPGNIHKVVFVPNYPDIRTFGTVDHVESEKLRINYIGAVRSQVDQFSVLFDAARKLPDISVKVHGGGADCSRLREMAKDIASVEVTGSFDGVEEAAKLYSQTDVLYCAYDLVVNSTLCKPNTYPVKFFEAVASCVPYIAPNGTAMASFADEYGVGWSVDMLDSSEVFGLIERLAEDPKQIEIARERMALVSEMFSWEKVVEEFSRVYEQNIEAY